MRLLCEQAYNVSPALSCRRTAKLDIHENFQGFTYCSIFYFQGSLVVVLFSAATFI